MRCVKQTITVSGAVAQFTRGMMQDVSGKLTKAFAECLKTNIPAEQEAITAEAAGAPEAASADGPGGEPASAEPAAESAESAAAAGQAAGGQPAAASAEGPPAAERPRPPPGRTA